MEKPRRSLFRRSLGVFAAAAFLPIAVMAVQGYRSARRAILDDRLLLMRQLSTVKQDEVEAGLRERARALAIVAGLPALREAAAAADAGTLGALLAGPVKDWIGSRGAAVLDGEGRPVASAGDFDPGKPWKEEALLAMALPPGGGRAHGRLRAVRPGVPVLRAAAPIAGPGGAPIGALAAAIDVGESLGAILGNEEAREEGRLRLYVLGTDGVPLSEVPGGEAGIRAILAEPATRFDHQGCENCSRGRCHDGEYIAPDGVRVIGSCSPSADRKWMVVAESRISEGALAATLHPFILGSLAASALALGALLLAGGLLGRKISGPIRSVAETARRIAGGDLSSRAVYGKDDEVGALVASFNSLVDGLISSREELRARNLELEDALAQLSRARDRLVQIEAISAVGRVAASVVHEIRNPLSSVKMNLQILSRPLQGDPRLAGHARIARDQVERLEKMLTDLLDYGRPLALRAERFPAGRCIDGALADVRARAEARRVELVRSGDPSVPVTADPDRITQVLVNVLANAIDASPEGGRVEVGASESGAGGVRLVNIEVRDRGEGIRPEHREEIFDPFFTTKEGGTGLGLAMAKKIVTLHGGRIDLESDPGRGTTVTVVLPAEI